MDDVSEDREWPSRDSLDFLDEIYRMVVQDVLVEGSKGDGKVVEYLSPEELTNKLDLQVVQEGAKWKDLVEECKKVIRYSIKTSRPAHMNTLLARVDMAALAGSWITDALNNTQTTFDAAPAFIVVEKYLIRELTKLVRFQDGDGIFVPGSSFGNIMAVHLARYRYNKDIKEKGMFGMPRLCIFCSEEAHYSAKKAANFLGFGTDSIVSVKTEDGRMIPTELEEAITACLKMGNIPLIVVATSGTTVLGGFDPLIDIVNICRKYKLWVHVDAAWGAPVIFSKQHRNLLSGLDQCDSVVWSLHKQLGAINQCSVLLSKENGLLMKCNSSNASYLFAQDKHYDTSFDIGDKTVQCGRKIDAFKFWMLWKSRGMVGMEKHVDRSFENTSYLVEKLKSREGFRLVPTSIQYINVCFWYIPVRLRGVPETNDWWREIYEVAPRIKAKMAHKGSMWITYQPLESRGFGNFFRIIVHEQCGKKDLDFILDEFEKLGHDL